MISPVFPSLCRTLSQFLSLQSRDGSGWRSLIRINTSSGSSFSMSGRLQEIVMPQLRSRGAASLSKTTYDIPFWAQESNSSQAQSACFTSLRGLILEVEELPQSYIFQSLGNEEATEA